LIARSPGYWNIVSWPSNIALKEGKGGQDLTVIRMGDGNVG